MSLLIDNKNIENTMENIYLKSLKYLYSVDYKFTKYDYYSALINNKIEFIKYLHSINCKTDNKLLLIAIENNVDLEILNYLFENYVIIDHDKLKINAAEHNNLVILKDLFNRKPTVTEHTGITLFRICVEQNNIDMMKFLCSINCIDNICELK